MLMEVRDSWTQLEDDVLIVGYRETKRRSDDERKTFSYDIH